MNSMQVYIYNHIILSDFFKIIIIKFISPLFYYCPPSNKIKIPLIKLVE